MPLSNSCACVEILSVSGLSDNRILLEEHFREIRLDVRGPRAAETDELGDRGVELVEGHGEPRIVGDGRFDLRGLPIDLALEPSP